MRRHRERGVKVGQVEGEDGRSPRGDGVYFWRGGGRMHPRQAEERDVVVSALVIVGVLELLIDLQSLGALVLVCPTVNGVAVYKYLHLRDRHVFGAVRGDHGPLLVNERGAAQIAIPSPLQDPVVFVWRDRIACRAAGGAWAREGFVLP